MRFSMLYSGEQTLSFKSCLVFYAGDSLKKNVFWNLRQMVEMIRVFCWHQMFVPKGFSALAPGLYTCIKSLKICIKSDFVEIILKLALYGQRQKAFLLSSKFCPQWIVCPCRGYFHMVTMEKNRYKIGIQSIFFKLQQMGKVIRAFCWHQSLSSKGCLPLPWGYIHI